MSTFVLVHSPLIGPLVWQGVAAALRKRQHRVVVPDLRDATAAGPPYWQGHVAATLAALGDVPEHSPLILVGHSGAGVLLPAIAAACARPLAAFHFVDADLPEDGQSRLDRFASAGEATQFRAAAQQGMLPPWTDEDLRAAIPDAALRARFVSELRPVPLAVYEEPIPAPEGWDEAPCGYLRFSDSYLAAAEEARQADWAYAELP
ncbi:MAG TPA: alpha/beta hydrolase, partial [Chloroflexota bacterium]|nr:alpha/beta hydrolase [Chloroflexota bacterium]